jgi:DNA-binding XRE family transcriptional regulator
MYQPTQIYNYNYAHHWREKRIARYLMWQWRVNQQSELSSLVKGTSSLVNSVVLNLDRGRYNQHEKEDVFDIEAKYRPDGDVPSYSDRERLERTLNRLSADEIIDFWEYREGWKPTWSRKSNWLDLWLNSEVLITPSETITKAYQHDSNGVSNRDEPSSSERSLSVLLSKVKKNHNLTQSEMAEKLDISQPYISSIINERKSPSSSTAENIRRKVSSLRNG